MATITQERAIEMLRGGPAGIREWNSLDRNPDLGGVSLAGSDLRGANLRGAYLRGADLRGCDLSGVDLSGDHPSEMNLWATDHDGADLQEANLSGAKLVGANLSRADLMRAKLVGADVRGARFHKAELIGANFERATFVDVPEVPAQLVSVVEVVNSKVIAHLARHPMDLHQLAPRQFEVLIAEILASYGW